MRNFITFILFVLLNQLCYSDIINVPEDFETIRGAIGESEDGDTILVQPGEYLENINFRGRAITVASLILTTGDEAYIDSTIINGRGRNSVVRFDSGEDETSLLTGFSITNGTGSPDIQGHNGGGGIMCLQSSPTLRYLKVFGNRALYGGGIMVQLSSPFIEFVSVFGNTAEYSGGGIYCSRQGCRPLISHSCIYRNLSEQHGGGLGCYSGASPVLEHVTLVFNRARNFGGGIFTELGLNHVRIRNTILWSNNPRQIYMGADTLTISYSDVQDGTDSLRGGIRNWGDGNMDDDPLFVDPDENDFHLTGNSPCIDTGDPNSLGDEDGSRADMGAYFCLLNGIVEGIVLDAGDDVELPGVTIMTTLNRNAITDENGFWSICYPAGREFDISVSLNGYLDSTRTDFEVQVDDTLEVTFGLLHSEFSPSEEGFTSVLDSGDSTSFDFSINNTGNGALNWEASKRLIDVPDPWELRRSFNVNQVVDDRSIWGVIFIEDHFYVPGSNTIDGNRNPTIYVLDREGHEINRFLQFGESGRGMRDLAWDGELMWGCNNEMIIGFTTQGDSVTAFESPYYPSSITWDTDREVFWIASVREHFIYSCNTDGNCLDRLPDCDLRPYGTTYRKDDPDGYNLYFNHRSDNTMIYKMNTENGDTMLVVLLEHDEGHSYRGCFITDQYDRRSSVFMNISCAAEDSIDIRQVCGNTSWMGLEPMAGEIESEASQNLTLSMFTDGIELNFWEGEIVFYHNAAGGETILPVTLTIRPEVVSDNCEDAIPDEFAITDIYPNPFNSTTRISYNLPQGGLTTLKIFDLNGREVYNLFNEVQEAGYQTITFTSEHLSNGIYFARLNSGKYSAIRKIAVVK